MMSDAKRADPLGDLSDFAPTPKRPLAEREAVREVSEASGFPSRAPGTRPLRRWRTGRNVQLNVKVTAETLERFLALADRRHVPLGQLLEQLLNEVGG